MTDYGPHTQMARNHLSFLMFMGTALSALAVSDVERLAGEGFAANHELADILSSYPGRRLGSANRQSLLNKIADRQAVLDALLADDSEKSLQLALELSAQLAVLTEGHAVGDPLNEALSSKDALDAGIQLEEWVDGSGNVYVVGGPAVDPKVVAVDAMGRRLSGDGEIADGARTLSHGSRGGAPGHIHHILVEVGARHASNRRRPGARTGGVTITGGNSNVAAGAHDPGTFASDAAAPATESLFPAVLPPLLARNLRSADGVPLSGFLYRGRFVTDVSHAVRYRCRDSNATTTTAGAQSSRRGGQRKQCIVGTGSVDVDSEEEAVSQVQHAWRAAVAAKYEKHGLRNGRATTSSTDRRHQQSNATDRALGINLVYSTGIRRCFMARIRWTGQALTDTSITSEASSRALAGQLVQLWRDQSYNRLIPVVENAHQCLYEMANLPASSVTGSSYTTMYSQLVTAAANHPDPTCRFTISSANYEHVMVLHPSANVGYAG